jgi:DNA polymerase-1
VKLADVRAAMAEARYREATGKASAAAVTATREPDVPADPPNLVDAPRLQIDFETTGVRWHAGDRPGGLGIGLPSGETWYLAWGHRGGGNNISEDGARRWMHDCLTGKRLTNISTGFEVHMSREFGVDLEGIGATVSDVSHWAALIDDHRKEFSLKALCQSYLPEDERKIEVVDGVTLDPARMMDYPASVVAVRAMADVRQVGKLEKILWPILDRDGLQACRALEDDVIFAACEMERNAAPLDMEKLERWNVESAEELDAARKAVAAAVGTGFQEALFDGGKGITGLNPDSSKDMEFLFKRLSLPIAYTESGKPSFTKDIIDSHDHPTLALLKRVSKLLDLRSKYLIPYLEAARRDGGFLRFRLHQCRTDEHGTTRGRFSASDKNIQQVMKPKKQRKTYGDKYIIRELFMPPKDCLLVSADASQIEYRIFASYANKRSVIEAYQQNPDTDFHELINGMIAKVKSGVDRDGAKTCNFLTVYGGGLTKLCLALGIITSAQFTALVKEFPMDPANGKFGPPADHPLLREGAAVKAIYDRVLPEAKTLAKDATRIAKERGYVKDCLGRRAYFPDGYGAHAALNAVIQPSAAEINKMKVVELHKARKRLGLVPMMTVHDEWIGGCPSLKSARALGIILGRQSFNFRVPITWDVRWGMNWSSVARDESQFEGMYASKETNL